MTLSPAHVAALRADDRVVGSVFVAGELRTSYSVSVDVAVLERVRVLANARAVPQHVAWSVDSMTQSRVVIYTTAPEWFAEIEEALNAARRQNY